MFQTNTTKYGDLRKSTEFVDRLVENDVDFIGQGSKLSGNNTRLPKQWAHIIFLLVFAVGRHRPFVGMFIADRIPFSENDGFVAKDAQSARLYNFLTCSACCDK